MLIFSLAAIPVYAGETSGIENEADTSSERWVIDDYGNFMRIRVLTAEDTPRTRATYKTLYAGYRYLTFDSVHVVSSKRTGAQQDTIECWNYGNYDNAGAVAFNVNGMEQSVAVGEGAQFTIYRTQTDIFVSARALWWVDFHQITISHVTGW